MATTSHSPKVEKASWDETNIGIFLSILVEEIDVGNRPAGHFTKVGWTNITRKFGIASGCNFTYTQLKNKWDNMKKEFALWEKLLHEETGLGYDHTTGSITVDLHWWRQKIKEKPKYRKFKTHGPIMLELQEKVFRGIVATGEYEYQPSNMARNQSPPVEAHPEHLETDFIDFTEGETMNLASPAAGVQQIPQFTRNGPGSSSTKPPKRKRTRTPSTRANTPVIMSDEMADFINIMKRTEETAQSVLAAETDGKLTYAECVSLCQSLPWMYDQLLIVALAVLEDNTKRIAFRGL